MTTYSKKKEENKLGFRTPEFFKGSKFSGSKFSGNVNPNYKAKFNPSQFRTQHKGGGGK